MIENIKRFVAYVCPECSGISDRYVSIFEFSGNKNLVLKCTDKYCKTAALTLSMKKDKMMININCPVCTQMHTFTISKSAFWTSDIITFNCPNSGIGIFFAGIKESVIDAVDENEKMLDEADDISDQLTGELAIILKTLDSLHAVMNEKRMICKCGSRNLFPVFDKENMYVECEDCKKRFPITPSTELLKLLSRPNDDFKL